MFEDVMTIVRIAVLVAGVCAVAIWAARQPDQDSALLRRLTGGGKKRAGE